MAAMLDELSPTRYLTVDGAIAGGEHGSPEDGDAFAFM
jgi:hypothetical protein